MFRRLRNTLAPRVVGIRREDKNVWERRVPLTPKQVQRLLERGHVKEVHVQPSTIRCFDDQAYEEVGAKIVEDLSGADTICAVKEVPPQLLIPQKTYMFFSHTIKAQPYNMPLLDTILEKDVRLIDYERIVGPDGRLVKFGPYAGFAGVLDTLHSLGLALLTRGYATPFLSLSLSKEYRTLAAARADLRIVGDQIRERGLPADVCPLTIAVTGSGSVSQAAQQFLHQLPCKYVDADELPRIWDSASKDRHHIYVTVVRARDMVAPKDETKQFSRREYYQNPELYKPVFHERIAPYTKVLINGMYWEPRYPRLLTTKQAQELHDEGRLPLLCLGDITCDVGGSVEFFVKATTIQNPLYVYDVKKEADVDIQSFNGEGIVILGVDHLPAEFPQEASRDFGEGLCPLLERVAASDIKEGLESQKKSLGDELFNAVVTNDGKLTPNYEYITEMRSQKSTGSDKKKILVIGAGMTAGPAVAELLKRPNNQVTLMDRDAKSLAKIATDFGRGAPSLGESSDGLRTVVADASTVDKYVSSTIKESDVVVSLLPATMHHIIAEKTIEMEKPLVTASYTSPQMESLRSSAEEKKVTIVNEMGLDPGIDIMTSAKLLNNIRKDGGIIKQYVSLCGALIQPENSDCPMGYKFSWFPRGVLTAITRPTTFMAGGQWFDVEGKYLYHLIQPISGFRGLDLHWIPNGNSTKYASVYGLDDCETIVRGTLRYSNFAPVATSFLEMGLLDTETKIEELCLSSKNFISWPALIKKLIKGTSDNVVNDLSSFLAKRLTEIRAHVRGTDAFKALNAIPMSANPRVGGELPLDAEIGQILYTFETLGLLSESSMVAKTASGLPIDSLCQRLEAKMSYKAHERDFVMMIHKIKAFFPSTNQTKTYTATLSLRGYDQVRSATAVTVGMPTGATAQLVLDKGLEGKHGIVIPTDPAIYDPILNVLEKEGIVMNEEVRVE